MDSSSYILHDRSRVRNIKTCEDCTYMYNDEELIESNKVKYTPRCDYFDGKKLKCLDACKNFEKNTELTGYACFVFLVAWGTSLIWSGIFTSDFAVLVLLVLPFLLIIILMIAW